MWLHTSGPSTGELIYDFIQCIQNSFWGFVRLSGCTRPEACSVWRALGGVPCYMSCVVLQWPTKSVWLSLDFCFILFLLSDVSILKSSVTGTGLSVLSWHYLVLLHLGLCCSLGHVILLSHLCVLTVGYRMPSFLPLPTHVCLFLSSGNEIQSITYY